MELIKILIVEDEWIISEEIKEILKKNGYQVIGQAAKAEEVFEIIKNTLPDLILMDIQLKGQMDGISLALKLKADYDLPIIFLTSFSDEAYLNKAKEVKPAAYLVKPFKEQDIVAAIEIAISNYQTQTPQTQQILSITESNQEWLFIKDNDRFRKILLTDIILLEAEGSYTKIYTKDKTILLAENLKQMSEKIKSPYFVRVHRSFMVNLNHVDSFAGNTIYLVNQSVPISQAFKEIFLRAINGL